MHESHDVNLILSSAAQHLRGNRLDEAKLLLSELEPSDINRNNINPVRAICKLLEKSEKSLGKFRILVGGYHTVDTLIDLAKFFLLKEGVLLEATIVPIGTWEIEIKKHEGLFDQEYDCACLFVDGDRVKSTNQQFDKSDGVIDGSEALVEQYVQIANDLQSKNIKRVMYSTIPAPIERVFGNYEMLWLGSPSRAIEEFNSHLRRRSRDKYLVFDLEHLAAHHGLRNWYDYRQFDQSKHPFSLDLHASVAHSFAGYILSLLGRSKKAIVVDLDNTLWGGVVGDEGADGIKIGPNGGAIGEAYFRFQTTLRRFRERGILLAVCSKNDESVAKAAFQDRTDMPLRLQDFSVFVANWNDKASNIRNIAQSLNIGTDSLVFLDDNPLERDLVKRELPEVAVLHLPEDPSLYSNVISTSNLFDVAVFSAEDELRANSIKFSMEVLSNDRSSTDLRGFLLDLMMKGSRVELSSAAIDRCAQLFQKTNQFQMTGIRPTKADIVRIMEVDPDGVMAWRLSDRHADHGIVTVATIEYGDDDAQITSWVMSCRVFSRTFENFVITEIVKICIQRNIEYISIVYRPNGRNNVSRDALVSMGFTLTASDDEQQLWKARCSSLVNELENFIQ
jgi:FkbH-like protein